MRVAQVLAGYSDHSLILFCFHFFLSFCRWLPIQIQDKGHSLEKPQFVPPLSLATHANMSSSSSKLLLGDLATHLGNSKKHLPCFYVDISKQSAMFLHWKYPWKARSDPISEWEILKNNDFPSMILQDLKESPEPLEVPKSWISDSLGSQTARVTVQPKRNWPSPFEAAAVEVVANLEGLYEKPATSHTQTGFKLDTFLCSKVCVWPVGVFHLFPDGPPFWSPVFCRIRFDQSTIRNSSEKTHLFGSHEAEVFFSFRMLPASKGTSSGDPLWLKVFLGNFPPRHYPTTEPPKTSTKTATCQCQFRILSYSNSVSGCLKKHHCNHWWLKLFRCLFFKQICSLNSDVLRLRWHSRSLVMDPGPGSQSSPLEYWLLHKKQLTSGEINSQLFITSQLFSTPLCQREVFFICDQATISKASPSQSCRSQ